MDLGIGPAPGDAGCAEARPFFRSQLGGALSYACCRSASHRPPVLGSKRLENIMSHALDRRTPLRLFSVLVGQSTDCASFQRQPRLQNVANAAYGAVVIDTRQTVHLVR